MNKHQEALNELKDLVHSELDGTKMLNKHLVYCNTLQELVDKYNSLKQENFDLQQTLNAEEESCAMFEKRIKELKEIIKSICKYLESKGLDLGYMLFSYLTPEEFEFCKGLLKDE